MQQLEEGMKNYFLIKENLFAAALFFYVYTDAKGSLARVVRVSPKTIAMLKSLPRNGEYIFNTNISSIRENFTKQRNKIAAKLQNPRFRQIHLHTIRHWKATMEYYRTKDIKYVQYLLGHKKIENTDIYTHLVSFENEEWHVAVAKNLKEEKKLIEVGFEFSRYRKGRSCHIPKEKVDCLRGPVV